MKKKGKRSVFPLLSSKGKEKRTGRHSNDRGGSKLPNEDVSGTGTEKSETASNGKPHYYKWMMNR